MGKGASFGAAPATPYDFDTLEPGGPMIMQSRCATESSISDCRTGARFGLEIGRRRLQRHELSQYHNAPGPGPRHPDQGGSAPGSGGGRAPGPVGADAACGLVRDWAIV